ncbi:type I restriction-modification system endonuclease [uncultured Megasphaera sp.]|uniref:type I restriction-modification system endonuclease n=1 Tax=uncultured Megasphaera sp. TaxID=165188 RepID=UPI002673EEA1|nr:type I restriction-modification system endonuclease [uncultured Megasphaera sp.]
MVTLANFESKEYPSLAKLADSAELLMYSDAKSSLTIFGSFAEQLTKLIFRLDGLKDWNLQQNERILRMQASGNDYPYSVTVALDKIRRLRNKAAHEADFHPSLEEALTVDQRAFFVWCWFLETFTQDEIKPYQKPLNQQAVVDNQQKKIEELTAEIEQLQHTQSVKVPESVRAERRRKNKKFAAQNRLTEAQTREIIDQQLRDAGWEADTPTLNNWTKGTLPQKGHNMAIAEWKLPHRRERADYVLFIGERAVGIVEAKRYGETVATSALGQAYDYYKYLKNSEKYQMENIAFLFGANGRPYLSQMKSQSGIWFRDMRNKNHPDGPLESWLTPDDIKMKEMARPEEDADSALQKDDYYPDFAGRYYQKLAIQKIEEAIGKHKNRILLAMATGTGKTRTAIALMYRLIKHKRARRILYLVDRQSLAQQTADALKDNKVEGQSISSIYGVKEYGDKNPEAHTRIHIATVQGLVQRLFHNEEELPQLSPGTYDFIIVDEAHRGYLEDREMSDEEMEHYDPSEYISQYRRVIDYFDAVAIGMTATPALNTVNIFGTPVYSYTYRQAVLDGYLMDHNAPYVITTELSKEGIHFHKDEEVEVFHESDASIKKYQLPDDMDFDVDAFNTKVVTESFNRVVCRALAERLDPLDRELGKTLIFAARDSHADMIVYLLQEAFAKADKPLPANAIMKITGHDRHKEQHIREFKNEEFPNIVVTVDLLTTGIDVPSIMNLVFMRRVKSRILFEQMLGRATRLFPGMDYFNIYDAVGQFASMEKVTDMNSVIHEKNVHRSMEDLFQLVTEAEKEGDFEEYRDQLIAKVQRKLHRLNEKERKSLETATGVKDLFQWARLLEKSDQQAMVKEGQAIWLIDAFHRDSRKVLISHQDDMLVDVRQSYGKTGEGPGDYLEEFNAFIKHNVNAIAGIGVIVNRPRDLTLKELQQIDAILQTQGFRERDLQSAWRQVNKEATAANIISFIRQAALGTPLESEDALVERAMSKVYGLAEWTPTQMKWLERIKKQLLLNNVLGPNAQVAFDSNDAFRSRGGYKGMQRIFKDKTDEIVDVINDIIFA